MKHVTQNESANPKKWDVAPRKKNGKDNEKKSFHYGNIESFLIQPPRDINSQELNLYLLSNQKIKNSQFSHDSFTIGMAFFMVYLCIVVRYWGNKLRYLLNKSSSKLLI